MHSAFVPDKPPCDRNSPIPRYLQVRDWLTAEIASGRMARGTKLPAERDWAPLLGVSQMTLNRAIQEVVREGLIVREVGRGTFVAGVESRRDGPGNGRAQTQTAHIGVVLHWHKDSDGGHYGSQMLSGIYNVAAERPARLSFAWGDPEGATAPSRYVSVAREMGVDGLLLVIPPSRAMPQIQSLQDSRIPFYVVGASWPDQGTPCIDFDNASGTEMAMRHLLAQGHRRVGLVRGAMHLRGSQVRVETFHHVLTEQGIAFDPAWDVVSSSFQMDGAAARRLEQVLQAPDAPTAWFAAGYHLSMQAVEVMRRLKRRIPDELAVIGFGDPFTAAYMHPPLTTVWHPVEELGELAATRLLDAIREGNPSPTSEILPVELVVRGSTAPPRSAVPPVRAQV